VKTLNVKDFNIGNLKAEFYSSFERTIEIRVSKDEKYDVFEIGYIKYNDKNIVLAVIEGTDENMNETKIPLIAQTESKDKKEYIIIFDYETYKRMDEQAFRWYIAHEVGHVICIENGKGYSNLSYEEIVKEVNEGKVNQHEHEADLEAVKLMKNKNTFIKSLEYLITRSNMQADAHSEFEIVRRKSLELRINAIKNYNPPS